MHKDSRAAPDLGWAHRVFRCAVYHAKFRDTGMNCSVAKAPSRGEVGRCAAGLRPMSPRGMAFGANTGE